MKVDLNLAEDVPVENLIEVALENSNGDVEDHPTGNGVYSVAHNIDISGGLIPGEILDLESRIEVGQIKLTNYCIMIRKCRSKWISVPLKSIETLDCLVPPIIKILCKDVKIFELKFISEEEFNLWERKLQHAIKPIDGSVDAFAMTFFESMKTENICMFNTLKEDSISYEEQMEIDFNNEFERLGFKDSNLWRITKVNENYELCETYPRHHIVPVSFEDEELITASEFRVNRRFPTPVWRHRNGAVLTRSSQPSIGWFFNRNTGDERLLENINRACGVFNDEDGIDGEVNEDKKLLVVDCRSLTSAIANRARGGGYENVYNYRGAEVRHMSIPNIHSVLKAYTELRLVLFNASDDNKRLAKNEDWHDTISNIMFSALEASNALEKSRPVLVHCSDGWDRTPQITSLVAILLDPFYRTIRGFQTLVDREFIDFGHKFSERNEIVSRIGGEKSPIFLQFLECVYQLIVQFPTEFEFNNEFLMKLAQHIYSNLFGDFLFNSSSERAKANVRNICFSVWSIFRLNRDRYVNMLYKPENQTIKPSAFSVNLVIWKPFYTWVIKFLNTDAADHNHEAPDIEPRRISSCADLIIRPNVLDQGFELVEIEDMSVLTLKNKSISDGMIDSWQFYKADPRLNLRGKTLLIDQFNRSKGANDLPPNYQVPKKECYVCRKNQRLLEENLPQLPSDNNNMNELLEIDGLNFIEGDVERTLLEKNVRRAEADVELLQQELRRLKEINHEIVTNSVAHHENVDQHSLPDSVGSSSQEQESVVSDCSSWEAVESTENPANWTPDHAASYCMDCQVQFWTGLRKHHCRVSSKNCGKVFCDKCTRSRLPVPKENLHVPVRVCRSCVDHQETPPRSPPMAVSN